MSSMLSFISDSNTLSKETISNEVEIIIDRKEIFIIVSEPIGIFRNRGIIINPIPIIKRVRPLSSWNIGCKLKIAPLIKGMFTFKIKASHIDPIKDPIKIKINAEIINGLII